MRAAGPRIADAQAPLDEGDGGGLGLDDDLDRPVEEGILVRVELALLPFVLARARSFEERFVELLLTLPAALLDDQRDLLFADVRALDALEPRGAERLEEHVALAEEALGPGGVEDDPAVGHARDGEGDSARGRSP